jgi:Tol biopolymer transport system component
VALRRVAQSPLDAENGPFCSGPTDTMASLTLHLGRAAFLLFGLASLVPASAREAPAEDELPLAVDRTLSFTVEEATWLSIDVSPDGLTLVLEILGDLYTMPVAGGDAVAITTGMPFDSQPRYSPDGRRIAFVSDRSGREAIWTVAADGSDPKRVAQAGANVQFASPSWAPDGSHIVVSRTHWSLATYELWAYHIDGGTGVQLTRAKRSDNTPTAQRHNALGAVYSPDGRYLYYANKQGGFGYNQSLPLWQSARWNLADGFEDHLTQAIGSAFRPAVSPDGKLLVYGTRHEHATGLRVRDLASGEDRWLVRPVQYDEQESRFTRDLLPGYAFTPDGVAVIYTSGGRLHKVGVASGEVADIPLRARVEAGLGPRLHFPYRIGTGPIKARMIRDPQVSPDGKRVAFAAFTRIHVHEFESGRNRAVTPPELNVDHAAWSPDGKQLAFVSWTSEGGQIWRMPAAGGRPRAVTTAAAYYSDPAWTPDGERIVALRATRHDRLYRDSDFGAPVGSDVVWMPARGGEAQVIVAARGLTRPHFGPEPDRVYLYLAGNSPFTREDDRTLVSVRFDGTDRREHLKAVGPGLFNAKDSVGAEDVRLAPDGRHALIQHANQVYVARLLPQHLRDLRIDLTDAEVPLEKLTGVGGDFIGWSQAGQPFWSAGHTLFRRSLDSLTFEPPDKRNDGDDDTGEDEGDNDGAETAQADGDAPPKAEPRVESEDSNDKKTKRDLVPEQDPAVASTLIEIWEPRHVPDGKIALVGATVLTMEPDAAAIENGVILIEGTMSTPVACWNTPWCSRTAPSIICRRPFRA